MLVEVAVGVCVVVGGKVGRMVAVGDGTVVLATVGVAVAGKGVDVAGNGVAVTTMIHGVCVAGIRVVLVGATEFPAEHAESVIMNTSRIDNLILFLLIFILVSIFFHPATLPDKRSKLNITRFIG